MNLRLVQRSYLSWVFGQLEAVHCLHPCTVLEHLQPLLIPASHAAKSSISVILYLNSLLHWPNKL